MSLPLVSVIIPTYNSKKYISQAIESVLKQQYPFFEIIIVDDGSTDQTGHLVRNISDKINYIYQENQGPSIARNTGIEHAKGEFIAFLDADDLWLPRKLNLQVAIMERQEEVGCVASGYNLCGEFTDQCVTTIGDKQGDTCLAFKELYVKNSLVTSSLLIRHECFEKVGVFDNTFNFGEDWDMWLRIAKVYKIYVLSECLCRYHRNREGSLTSSYSIRNLQDWAAIIEKNKSDVSCINYNKALSWYYFNYSYVESVKGNRLNAVKMLYLSALKWPLAIYNNLPVVFRLMMALYRVKKR